MEPLSQQFPKWDTQAYLFGYAKNIRNFTVYILVVVHDLKFWNLLILRQFIVLVPKITVIRTRGEAFITLKLGM